MLIGGRQLSQFCFVDHGYERIQKARKRPNWSKTRNPKRMEALAKRFGSAVRADFLTGIRTFKKRVSLQSIYDAWLTGRWENIDRIIPWHRMDDDFGPLNDQLLGAAEAFGALGLEVIDKPMHKELRYDLKNQLIRKIVKKRIAEKIVNPVLSGGRENIRRIVQDRMKLGLTNRQIAERIRDHIGLDERRAIALDNYFQGRMKAGVKINLQQNYHAYRDKLLMDRAKTIAKTETQNMLNRGQLEIWKEGIRQGLIPADAEKVWVVDGDPCPMCEDMDGESIPVHDSWDTDNGEVDIPSDIHPNCECIMTIEI